MGTMTIYTVGHSNVSGDALIALLRRHAITAIADVRSHPYSRFLPHFSPPALRVSLEEAGIRYVFLGRELGAPCRSSLLHQWSGGLCADCCHRAFRSGT